MKLTIRARLPRCFGGGHPHLHVVDEEQRDKQIVELAADVAKFGEDLAEMARQVAEVRQMNDDLARAWEELEQLLPEFFLYRSRWQRIKDAFRRPGSAGAGAASTARGGNGQVTVQMMSPFLREFLSMDD